MRRLNLRWVLATVAMLIMTVAPALAGQTPQDGFFKMEDVPRESLPHVQLVLAAYAFVWLALIAYVWTIWRRIGRVERELAVVTRQLRERKR